MCFSLITLVMFTSCEYEIIEFDKPDPTVEIKFSSDIIPIFNKNCNTASCHTVGHSIVDLSPANAYKDLIAKNMIDKNNPAESRLYKVLVKTGGSHSTRSTPEEQQKILLWIEKGAIDN